MKILGKLTLAISVAIVVASGAMAAPLFPTIDGHDFSFLAQNNDIPIVPEWSTNGTAPDTLNFIRNIMPQPLDHEVTGYKPFWPAEPLFPVFNEFDQAFGGDLVLGVKFTGQDAPYVNPVTGDIIDVSLTGTGINEQGADLMIYGSVMGMGPGLLWAIDLEEVSLYGRAGTKSYKLEGKGTIVGGAVAEEFRLLGTPGVMRGDLDFFVKPSDWLPAGYDPLKDTREKTIRAAFSGETGAVPEPGTVAAIVTGLAGLVALRRKK